MPTVFFLGLEKFTNVPAIATLSTASSPQPSRGPVGGVSAKKSPLHANEGASRGLELGILPQYELDNQGPSAKMLAERGVGHDQEMSFRQAGQAILTQVTLGASYVLTWHPWYEKNRAHHQSVGDQSLHRVALRLD